MRQLRGNVLAKARGYQARRRCGVAFAPEWTRRSSPRLRRYSTLSVHKLPWSVTQHGRASSSPASAMHRKCWRSSGRPAAKPSRARHADQIHPHVFFGSTPPTSCLRIGATPKKKFTSLPASSRLHTLLPALRMRSSDNTRHGLGTLRATYGRVT